jgi:subtilase family serine protease
VALNSGRVSKRSWRFYSLASTLAGMVVALTITPAASGAVRDLPNKPVCPGPVVGRADCHSRVITHRGGTPLATSAPTGYGPAQFHGAYNLPNTAPSSQTIAIVDAYDDPTAGSDLNAYSSYYGLPACTTANGCFQKVNQDGNSGPYPSANAGWALEIALDVETAHQICQNCKILLVETDSNSFTNLTAGVNTAASLGATEISNSWGGSEYSGETSDTSFNHPGIAITASSGDSGYGAEYPASSPYVIAVGGTSLNVNGSNGWNGETVWSGAGSGCSAYASAQAWQTSNPNWSQTGCGTKRGVADVAADADPNTGASVYDTTQYQGQSGWFTLGGTSLSAPLIAGVYALAGGGSASYPASVPYGHQSDSPATLHDVTSGSDGNCATIMCHGAVGYDGPTGVGTPNGLVAFAGGSPGSYPPAATTGSATNVGQTSATLNGTVNPSGQQTSYHFEYGTTQAYGQSTASQSAGSGTSSVAASANLSGLTAGTTYHYRLVASNGSGTTNGSDQTFTTTSSAPPPPNSPPAATTDPATNVIETSATLNGTVNPSGQQTSYHFQWGTTASYGQSTASQSAGSGTSNVAASANLSGLTAGTTYHYRLVASNGSGTTNGSDQTFTTASSSFPGPPPGSPPDTTAPELRIASGAVRLTRKGVAKLNLTCPSSEPNGPCAGDLKLRTKGKVRWRGHRSKVTLGATTFSIPSGRTVGVKVRLSKDRRKLVERLGSVLVKATAHAHDSLGNAGTATQVFKLRAP